MITVREVTLDDTDALGRIMIGGTWSAFEGRVPERCLSWLPDGAPGERAEHEAASAANWRKGLADGLDPGEVFLVAVDDGGAVIGLVDAFPIDDPDFDGEIGALYILPSHQGRGVGRTLLTEAARRLSAQGVTSLKVGVLSINPNRPFYERLGGRLLYERDHDWDGTLCSECFYGWDDIATLIR